MSEADRDELFRRNLAAFKVEVPHVWSILTAIVGKTVSHPVFDGDRLVNIDLGEIRLYPENGPEWAAAQTETYFRKPDRLGFDSPTHCNLSAVSIDLLRRIASYWKDRPSERSSAYPVVDTGFAFVFGVGLGFHVVDFLKRNLARTLVLVEPVPEFLLHSLYAIDWEEVFRDAKEKGVGIRFVLGGDPATIVREIEFVIQNVGSTFLDGSYAYLHYFSWTLRESRQMLNEKIKVFYLSSGFFEDEILMMRNTYDNLRKFEFHVIHRSSRVEQQMPVFVVGSGGSLDRTLPFIKKWRDRVILFSCGTSLGILLKNGLRPDLHVENENTFPLVRNLRKFKAEYGFEGIRLVATSTLRPEASELFDRRWFYYRAALSSAHILVLDNKWGLSFADPLVVNAACSVCVSLGFQNIYLFGVDCGRPLEGPHHSKDAVYFQEGYEGPVDTDANFEREVPGNFGGKVLTSWSLDLSRRTLTSLMLSSGQTFINCSHGARIDGARPKVAAAIQLTNPPNRQEAVLKSIEERLITFGPGGLLDMIDLQPHIDAHDVFFREFDALIEAAKAEDDGFWEFEKRIENFWHDDWSEHKGLLKIIGGSFASMVRLGAYAGTRVRDPKARKEFFLFFLDQYRDLCMWMAGETQTLLTEIAEGKEELSDVGKREQPAEADAAAEAE